MRERALRDRYAGVAEEDPAPVVDQPGIVNRLDRSQLFEHRTAQIVKQVLALEGDEAIVLRGPCMEVADMSGFSSRKSRAAQPDEALSTVLM